MVSEAVWLKSTWLIDYYSQATKIDWLETSHLGGFTLVQKVCLKGERSFTEMREKYWIMLTVQKKAVLKFYHIASLLH
jgi:hypothetical protein